MTDAIFKSLQPPPPKDKTAIKKNALDGVAFNGISESSSNHTTIITVSDKLFQMFNEALRDGEKLYDTFSDFVEETKKLWLQWKLCWEECQSLRDLLDTKVQEVNELKRSLLIARAALEKKNKRSTVADQQLEYLKSQLVKVTNLFRKFNLRDSENINTTEGSLEYSNAFLNDAVLEISESYKVDASYSRHEDYLDASQCFNSGKSWKPLLPAEEFCEPKLKKVDTCVPKITSISISSKKETTCANSNIPSINKQQKVENNGEPSGENVKHYSNENLVLEPCPHEECAPATEENINHKEHHLEEKIVLLPVVCMACDESLGFGKTEFRCEKCRSYCHTTCQSILSLSCVPVVGICNRTIGYYTPNVPPMVPDLVSQCLKEIEERGLLEMGLYRIERDEMEFKALKEEFLSGNEAPDLKKTDIHVICGCLKDFLQSLSEPLVPYTSWKDLTKAITARNDQDIIPILTEIISNLPRSNRDTLAYIILHLKKVSESPKCEMPVDSLTKVFGAIIIGHSTQQETWYLEKVMEYLIRIPSDCWMTILNIKWASIETMAEITDDESLTEFVCYEHAPNQVK